jgi:hypothetical protein
MTYTLQLLDQAGVIVEAFAFSSRQRAEQDFAATALVLRAAARTEVAEVRLLRGDLVIADAVRP